jgi:hypothetical protein
MRCGEFVKDIATGYQGVVKSMSQFVRAFVRPTADAVPLLWISRIYTVSHTY